MELTPIQHRAARACGFAFFPVTEAQVQRLTMQKRVFRLDGQSFMVTRDGAFWKTHGTLLRAIEGWVPCDPQPTMPEAERPPHPREAAVSSEVPPPVQESEPAGPGATPPDETAGTPPRAARRRTGTRAASRHNGEGTAVESTETAAAKHAAASTSEAPEVAPEYRGDAVPESQGAVR